MSRAARRVGKGTDLFRICGRQYEELPVLTSGDLRPLPLTLASMLELLLTNLFCASNTISSSKNQKSPSKTPKITLKNAPKIPGKIKPSIFLNDQQIITRRFLPRTITSFLSLKHGRELFSSFFPAAQSEISPIEEK